MWEILVGVVTYLSRAVGRSRERPERLFRDHVVPLHEDLLRIQEDYTESFAELADLLDDESLPMREIAAHVDRHRKRLNPVRVGTGELAKALSELFAFRFQRKAPPEDSAEHLLFQYADAVIHYLYGTFELPEPDTSECGADIAAEMQTITETRYSGFAKVVREARREKCERDQLRRVVGQVEGELERSWTVLAERYGVLKARCLT